MTNEIISRKQAKELGLKRYFTGKPCVREHIAKRATTSGRCVECNKIICSSWQKDNREKVNESHQKWLSENSEKYKESRRNWYSRNIEDRREYHKEWYNRNPEDRRDKQRKRREDPNVLNKHNQINAKWREKNPNYFREWGENNPERRKSLSKASKAKRRTLEKNAEGSHSADDIERIYILQSGKCVYCKKILNNKYQLDHIVPLSRGGTNYSNNIQLLCENVRGQRSCNQLKRDKDPIEFAQSLGLLL